MVSRIVETIVFLVLVSTVINAQERKLSTQERAEKLEPFIIESARRHGIDPRILRVICYLESRYRIEAVSPKGARGPMQFMPDTARRYALRNPHDPKWAIDAGARYFRDLLRRFEGRVDLALAAYNAGEGAVEAFMFGRSLRSTNGRVINPMKRITGGIPPYRETEKYVSSAISFLGHRAPLPTGSSSFPQRSSKKSNATTSRDFTLDVMFEESVFPQRSKESAKSTFFEIQ